MNNSRQFTWSISLMMVLLVAAATLCYRSALGMAGNTVVVPFLQNERIEVPTNQIIIKYWPTADLSGSSALTNLKREQRLSVAGVELVYVREMSGDAHVLRLPAPLSVSEVEAIAVQIEALPDVAYAEPDRFMFPALTPDDPQYGSQWHYFEAYGINAPAGWDITTGSGNVRLAVLDSGVTDHADLNGRWIGGYDFITNTAMANDGNGRDDDPHDPGDWVAGNECFPGSQPRHSSWHGTHVAGTIGAASNNSLGVAGVNWVSLMVPVRVIGKCGGFISDIADGMRWAAGLSVSGVPANPHPAKVLNMSLSGPGMCSTTYQNAINAINAIGGIIVVAAGNNSSNLNTTTYQPANCNGVITVAATDRDGHKALYSNYGAIVKISAPGGENLPAAQNGVFSTINRGLTTPEADSYGFYQGTSMAAPHVAGVISLLLSLDPTLNFSQSLQILQDTASPFPGGSTCNPSICGSGIVNMAAALHTFPAPSPTPTATLTNTPLPPTASNTPSPTTSTATSTSTPSVTSTATMVNTVTPSTTLLPTVTATATPTHTPELPDTLTPSNTPLPSATYTPTASNTPSSPTITATNTPAPSSTPMVTATSTPTSSLPTATATPLNTATHTPIPSHTPMPSNTPSPSNTSTSTPTATATNTMTPPPPTAVVTATSTHTATHTPTPLPAATPTSVPPPSCHFVYLPAVMKQSHVTLFTYYALASRRVTRQSPAVTAPAIIQP